MKKALLTVVIFLCLSLSAFAQDTLWSRTYGGADGESGHSVQQTGDEGYIVVGSTNSFGTSNGDVYLVKTDSSGHALWSRTYGGNSEDRAYSVQQTTEGGYILAGHTYSFGHSGVYLIKADSLGDILWSCTYGGSLNERGRSVQETTDGGYIVAGQTDAFGAGNPDVYLIKTNSIGDTLWSRTYGGILSEGAYCVQQTTDGGYIVVAYTYSFGAGDIDVYLIKTDSLGDTLWARTYGGTSWDQPSCVRQTTDGGYIVTGFTASFGAAAGDAFLLKTDSNGHTLWMRTYGGSKSDDGESVQQTADGGYVVTGRTYSFGVVKGDVYLFKTNSNGDILWSRTFGGSEPENGISVLEITDRGYMVAGYTWSFGVSGGDVMLTKLDSVGNTCIGEFVSSTVMSVSCSVTSPGTVVTLPPTIVTSPPTEVTSPATEVTTVCVGTDVRDETGSKERPSEFALLQNYPNPFNQTTKIEFTLAKSGFVSLSIYDLLGRKVRTLISKHLSSGYKSVLWNGKNNSGKDVASGIYFYQIKVENFIEIKKLVLLK